MFWISPSKVPYDYRYEWIYCWIVPKFQKPIPRRLWAGDGDFMSKVARSPLQTTWKRPNRWEPYDSKKTTQVPSSSFVAVCIQDLARLPPFNLLTYSSTYPNRRDYSARHCDHFNTTLSYWTAIWMFRVTLLHLTQYTNRSFCIQNKLYTQHLPQTKQNFQLTYRPG